MRYHNTSKGKVTQAVTDQNRKAALEAAEHGQRVFPVIVTLHPNNPEKKKANIPVKWKTEATTDPDQIDEWWDEHPDATPGMMTGDCLVVDLDTGEGKDGAAEYRAMGLDPEDALCAVDTPSGGEHLYFDNKTGLTISGGKGGISPGIDTRGIGGFVFAPGARTIFGEYRLKRGDLTDIQFGCLTQVPKPVRQALAKPKATNEQPDPGNADVETIRVALSYVSSDCGYADWVGILMAVHHGTGGSKHGLALVIGWSAGPKRFSIAEVQDKWRSFGNKDGRQITVGTLFDLAEENGWKRSDPNDLLTNEDVPGVMTLEDIDGMLAEKEKPFFLDMADLLANPAPPREWLVPDWIPAKTVHMMGGDGGVGKTLLAMQLAVSTGTGVEWLGHTVSKPGVSLYYGAEDDRDEMHRRLEDVCCGLDVDPADYPGRVRLRAAIAEDTVFATVAKDGRVKPTPVLKRIETEIAALKPTLVVLDTLSNLHALDPNSQEQAKAFIGLLIAIGQRHDCTFVLLAHPSRSGMASGDGDGFSVGWSNAVRSRSYFEADASNPDINILTSKKANYGKRGLTIKVAWTEGYYVKVNDEYADASKAKHVFLEILDRLTKEGTFVSRSNGVNYAPHRFAEEPEADEENITKGQFVTAMKSMLRDGVLVSEDYQKKDRKWGKRIARGNVPLTGGDLDHLLEGGEE